MKCLALFFLVAFGAAAVSASFGWTTGRQYVYAYRSRTMTGIPYLENQVSGLGISSKVIIQVLDNQDMMVQMTEIGKAQVANQIFPQSWTTWRKALPLSYTPLEQPKGLNTPFKVIIREGQVQAIEVSSQEPIWVVNIKRALASQLSLNMIKFQGGLQQNEISKRPEEFFTVEAEPSVTGKCRTHYTVVPLPEYIAELEEREIPQDLAAKNQERPAWIITKTKDYNRCVEKPAFVHSSVVDTADHGSSPMDAMHKRFSSRTSVARFLIRGQPQQKFVVERVWTEGDFVIRPFATETESIFISSNQTLVLKQEEQIQNPLPEPQSKVSKSLVYQMQPSKNSQEQSMHQGSQMYNGQYQRDQASQEYQRLRQELEHQLKGASRSEEQELQSWNQQRRHQHSRYAQQQEWEMRAISRDSDDYPELTKAPKWTPFAGKPTPVAKVQEQIKQLVQKAEQEIESMETLADKDLPMNVIEMSRALQTLDLDAIRQVYQEIVSQGSQQSRSQKTIQTIFLDAVAMSGSNPCIVFLKEVIQKREVKGERAAQLLMVLPATIKTPTQEVLHVLVELIKEVKSFQNKQVWYTALLSTATIINRACVDPKTRRHNWAVSATSSRPYCTPQAVELLLPYIKAQIEETQDKYNYVPLVQAIGNLGSPEAIPILKQIIYGEISQCKQVRSKAIFALVRIVKSGKNHQAIRQLQKEVQAILKPVFASPLEPQEVRMSAFYVLITTEPDETFFTEAATGTWFETNQQVGQFVYSTLINLANCSYPTHYNLTTKAAMALPLAKKYNLGIQYSNNYLFNHVIPRRHIGSLFEYIQFSGKHSVIPEQLFVFLKNHIGGFDMPILESSFQIQGIQTWINKIIGPHDRTDLPDPLNIHTRKDYDLNGAFWMRLMGSMERVFTLETIQEWAREGIIEYTGQNSYSFNYQKTIPIEDIIMVLPTESGLPIYISKKVPLFISLRGDAEVEMDSKQFNLRRMEFPSDIKFKFNVKPLVTMTRMIEAGISSPLTDEVFLSGHKSNSVFSLPLKFEVEYKNKEVKVIFKEFAKQQAQHLDIFAIKTYPYTAQTKFFDFVNKNMKTIKPDQEIYNKRFEFGQRYFGLDMSFQVQMPGRWNFGGWYDLVKPHNFLTFTQYLSLPHNLRQHAYKLQLNQADSATKEVVFKFYYDSVHKQFALGDYEEDQKIESKYYKHQHASSKFQAMKEALERFFKNPQSLVPEMRNEQEQEQEQYRQGQYSVRSSEHRRRYDQEEESGLQMQTQSTGKTRSLHVDVELLGQGQQAVRKYRSSVLLSVSPCATKYQGSFMFEREASSGLSQYKVYAKGQLKYPYLPSKRQEILNMDKNVLGYLSINYGKLASSKIETKIALTQTPEWRQKVQESKVTQECQKYEQEGSPYSPNCLHARREAAALNRVVLQIQSQEMPRALYNATLKADDLFKYYFYPYLTNKRMEIENPQGQIKIIMDIKPVIQKRPWPLLSLQVYKPRENTFMDEIKLNPWLETVLPLNAEMRVSTKAINKVLGWQYTPFCELSRESITTFDNVTYQYPLSSSCYHLVAKDCSKQIPVQVMAKQEGQGKQIKFQVGKMVVEVTPELKVLVDGSVISVRVHEEKVIKNADDRKVLVILRTKKDKVKVTAPIHGLRIKSDGKHFRVEMSNMYRGRVCGLCGDMDGEKSAEFKDPQECVRMSARNFGDSYGLGSCARRSEATRCLREQTISGQHGSAQLHSRRSSSSAVKYSNKVVTRQGETCFSVKPVPECKLGYKPSSHITKEIGFHCLPQGRAANALIARSRSEVLEDMRHKQVDFKEYVSVPESCQHIKGQQLY